MYTGNPLLEYNHAFDYLQRIRDTKFEETPTYRVFNKRYRISSKFLETLTIEELKARPFLESGFEEFDQMFKEEEIIRWYTTDEMVELYNRNVGFKILNQRDLNAIYNDIHDHLLLWCSYLQTDLSANKVPLSELNMLSDFATVILEHVNKRTGNIVRHRVYGYGDFNGRIDKMKFSVTQVTETKIDMTVPPHIQIIEFINKSAVGMYDPCERLL